MFKQLGMIAGAAAIALTGYMMLPAQAEGNRNAQTMASKETKSKPIEVRICPIIHSVVKGEGAGSQIVGKYKAYFCCGGCVEAFNKLTPAQKLQKVQEAYLIQQHNEKKKKEAQK